MNRVPTAIQKKANPYRNQIINPPLVREMELDDALRDLRYKLYARLIPDNITPRGSGLKGQKNTFSSCLRRELWEDAWRNVGS
jgi:hypothetical protein